MNRTRSIQTKLLLGIGILIIGYIASAAVIFVSGAKREQELGAIGSISMPLSLKCQSALFAFEGSIKAFNDATMMGEAEDLQTAAKLNANTAGLLGEIGAIANSAGLDQDAIIAIRKQVSELDSQRDQVFNGMSKDAASREATRSKAEALGATTDKLRQFLTQLSDKASEAMNGRLTATTQATHRQRIGNLIMATLIVLAGSAVVVFVIRRSIVGPIGQAVASVDECTDSVKTVAQTIRESGSRLAEGSSSQAASLQETSATLEQIASMADQNAKHSAVAKDQVSAVRNVAENSINDVGSLRDAMGDIKQASNNIAKIVKTIDEIAFQTNILALNAAVEAARAGEAGAGFAIVAEEVRNLAQRSATAARETAQLIDDSIAKSDRGVQISQKVGEGLEHIGAKIREMDSLVAEIAKASLEQSTGVSQVNQTVTRLNQSTQATAAAAEESSATVEELAAQVQALNSITSQLKCTIHGSAGQ
jgi:methyl-accepting chemotaxis protein